MILKEIRNEIDVERVKLYNVKVNQFLSNLKRNSEGKGGGLINIDDSTRLL